jgi:hypothetical protein
LTVDYDALLARSSLITKHGVVNKTQRKLPKTISKKVTIPPQVYIGDGPPPLSHAWPLHMTKNCFLGHIRLFEEGLLYGYRLNHVLISYHMSNVVAIPKNFLAHKGVRIGYTRWQTDRSKPAELRVYFKMTATLDLFPDP